jgi:hypothetical protein
MTEMLPTHDTEKGGHWGKRFRARQGDARVAPSSKVSMTLSPSLVYWVDRWRGGMMYICTVGVRVYGIVCLPSCGVDDLPSMLSRSSFRRCYYHLTIPPRRGMHSTGRRYAQH